MAQKTRPRIILHRTVVLFLPKTFLLWLFLTFHVKEKLSNEVKWRKTEQINAFYIAYFGKHFTLLKYFFFFAQNSLDGKLANATRSTKKQGEFHKRLITTINKMCLLNI